MNVCVKVSTLKNPFLNSALQNICVALLSSISFSKIYLSITRPILPYKHDAFDLNITIALWLKAVLHTMRL